MPGLLVKLDVSEGEEIQEGQALCTIEAMKMENNITAEKDAIVEQVVVKEDDMVDASTQLVYLKLIDKE